MFVLAGTTFAATDTDAAWTNVKFEARGQAPLLEREAKLPPEQTRHAVTIAVLVLEPDLEGVVSAVAATYDNMENPSEAEVTVTVRGILDDDLLAVRHIVSLARNSKNEWRVVGYRRGELRRSHLH